MYCSIFDCQLPIADLKLEIGNRKSAMSLPARLYDAGNLSLQRQLAKTDAAELELAQVAARATAPLAASVLAHAKLRSPPLFCNQ
jgi:hypothetical protein